MRYLLNEDHYASDRLLPKGSEVGDGDAAIHPWRYDADVNATSMITTEDGIKEQKTVRKAGEAMPPSRNMTPLDDETRKQYREYFGTDKPEADPTKAIPIQGTLSSAKAPPLIAKPPKPSPSAPTPHGSSGTQSSPPPANAGFATKEPPKVDLSKKG